MRRAALGARLALAIALASGVAAAKPLDPETADALVQKARSDGSNGFCTAPQLPLSFHARSLCPVAREVKGCEGLVAACDEDPLANPMHVETPHWSFAWLGAILSVVVHALVWVLILGVVGIVLWFVAKAIVRAQRDRKAAERPAARAAQVVQDAAAEALDTRTDAELLLREAGEHARRGDLDRAATLYLAASLRALDKRGAIRIARHRTNGEYVRSCKEPETKPDLRVIVREVDRVQFGRESATAARIAEVAARASAIVARTAALALVAMATMVILGGCKPGGPLLKATDPTGDDLFFELLERQGAHPSRLGGSLATLPMPKEKETAPLVIVDASRVPLEVETRAHLARWVEAGGRLLLAGDVHAWPESFKAKAATTQSTGVNVLLSPNEDDEQGDGETDDSISETYKTYAAKVGSAEAIDWPHAYTLASTDTHEVYAAARAFERGVVIGFAGDDLFTNAGIARPPNAAAVTAILQVYATGRKIQIARPEDGISPPSSPLASLAHAGLGLALVHAAAATLLLMLAFGIRQARAKVSPPKARRAWTEHIEATGGLYARARLAPHALAAYTRFVDGRLRERMPRGMSDPAAFLALRANADPAWAAEVWRRASTARSADRPEGDELATLRHLSALYAAAVKSD